ncbi:MAG: hypothetical protein HY925_10700 [Elusimicrobia bacterium]|nr:hypothetical protein [Elusimicrobiota bacterium]
MIRRDWYKRHVEILAQAIGNMLGLKQRGETQAAIAAAEKAVREAFGMDGKLALGLSLEQVLFFACRGEKATPELLATLADLFSAWGEALDAAGRSEDARRAAERTIELRRLAGA